ncbi:hypothetical protein Gogos_022399, partial [Gossypium gossypioides]|nr:hypothetical protein [Gossypium gossypioides]
KILASPQLSAVKENKEHLAETIDRCHNDLSYYQTQARIDLISKAKYLLQEKDYKLWTDGRRILTYHSLAYHSEERDEESCDY